MAYVDSRYSTSTSIGFNCNGKALFGLFVELHVKYYVIFNANASIEEVPWYYFTDTW